MLNTYTLLVILVLCWTLNPFMKKKASLNLSSDEYLIFNHTLCSILLVIYLIYLIKYKKCNVKPRYRNCSAIVCYSAILPLHCQSINPS